MKLQWMKDLLGDAYTEELDAKVCAALGERFVSRQDFNEKNTKLREAEAQIAQLSESAKAYTAQLAELKKSAGDTEALTKKIGEMEERAKADKASYEKELAAVRLTAAVDAELPRTQEAIVQYMAENVPVPSAGGVDLDKLAEAVTQEVLSRVAEGAETASRPKGRHKPKAEAEQKG